MNRFWLFLTGFVLVVLPAKAADMLAPDPGLAPVRVVEIQLDALQANDDPSPDSGIAQTWAFAHPDNRRVTGPLERFAAMIKGPHYRSLLGHREHDIKSVFRNENMAVFAVTIVTSEGEVLSFQWQVAKVASGQFSGAWMTVGVSPPLRPENAI